MMLIQRDGQPAPEWHVVTLRRRLLVSLQVPLSPMVVFAIGIEEPVAMPVDGLQRCRSGKEHRVVLLGRPGEVFRR
jgi:hypothetical protein